MENKISGLSHLFVTMFLYVFGSSIVIPSLTDVTMFALCPGRDECSFAIYLSGFQQAITGVGMVVMTPLIGNLSDKYGRKALLTIPVTLNIIPLVILAYSRSTDYYYAYYVMKSLTAMVSDGSTNCLALSYVADNISEERRASAFGIMSGVISASFVCASFTARFLSTDSIFKVAALASMCSAVYMRIFLKESLPHRNNDHNDIDESGLTHPILKAEQKFEKTGLIVTLICLLKTSKTFSQAAFVSFFHSLGDGGFQASLMYFLKARFQFNKDQFADILLIAGIAGSISQLLLMPLLARFLREEKLLSLGLFVASISTCLYSLSRSAWVPYAISGFCVFSMLTYPTVRSIASKQVGPGEQGKAQGCISGLSSFATIIAPFIFSPLTALFLSDRAPFYFPGFSILCIGFAFMIAFAQSTMIKSDQQLH